MKGQTFIIAAFIIVLAIFFIKMYTVDPSSYQTSVYYQTLPLRWEFDNAVKEFGHVTDISLQGGFTTLKLNNSMVEFSNYMRNRTQLRGIAFRNLYLIVYTPNAEVGQSVQTEAILGNFLGYDITGVNVTFGSTTSQFSLLSDKQVAVARFSHTIANETRTVRLFYTYQTTKNDTSSFDHDIDQNKYSLSVFYYTREIINEEDMSSKTLKFLKG
jgi:hypothetical protein